ncbi:MAG: hypothetical protein ACK41T_07055 [Pseudobdellovibrio sp.]
MKRLVSIAAICFIASTSYSYTQSKLEKFLKLNLDHYADTVKTTAKGCDAKYEIVRESQIQQLQTQERDACFITIDNRNNYQTMTYRSYLASNEGSLFLFVSYGRGVDYGNYGAKEFYFFPRNVKEQTYVVSSDALKIDVLGSVNFDFTFDSISSQLVSVTNANLVVDPKISPDNDGGVFITPKKGLVYELPFVVGNAPSVVFSAYGTFKDAYGNKCKVQVGKMFRPVRNGDSEFRHTDAQLKKYLKTNCPAIKY